MELPLVPLNTNCSHFLRKTYLCARSKLRETVLMHVSCMCHACIMHVSCMSYPPSPTPRMRLQSPVHSMETRGLGLLLPCEGLEFSSQTSHGHAQPLGAPVPQTLTPSSGLLGHCTHVPYIHTLAHTYIKKNVKAFFSHRTTATAGQL